MTHPLRTVLLVGLLVGADIGIVRAQVINANIPTTSDGYTADFNMSAFSLSSTYQWVYFPSDRQNNLQNRGRIYWNVRQYSNGTWTWLFNASPFVLDLGPGYSVSVGDVLYDAAAPFVNPSDGQHYAFAFYFEAQPSACGGAVAAFMYVSFSNSGVNDWTTPIMVHNPGGPSFPCWPGYTDTVPVES